MKHEFERQQSAWRDRKKAMLRDNIVRNALDLFARHGYDAVSLDEIVEASHCSRSTFHRHFGTKEDLLFPGAEEYLTAFEHELAQVADGDDPWVAARAGAIRGLHGFIGSLDPDLKASFARLWLSGPIPRRRYQEIVMSWETVLVVHFGRSLGPGSSEGLECQLLASMVTAALRAALNVAVTAGDDVDVTAARAFDLVESSPLVHQLRAAARPAV
ncbi:TetR/AcrR family transcriptional regulator [Mycobacterium sp.]|uniref:TetR/AcrR family transcriptional regulator n=1 Tax=Mycobacterium sp. TaxID=1785 RepID=UPI00121E5A0B|nr:TetR/AcrR family transcriptional regulator [Mycobacterium sp.]TAM67185.1 MAG: TetR/AcrR family transcriptional regulator [Mycobacterium sp.]